MSTGRCAELVLLLTPSGSSWYTKLFTVSGMSVLHNAGSVIPPREVLDDMRSDIH